ncbi:MAG: hypothetical protein Q8L41_11935 [Anaerolineales bacterium]|nr:hypothetical protein [Anaerolineales bacterium]
MVKRKRSHSIKDQSTKSFRVKPANKPEVIDYYLTSPDGKDWTRHPGNVIAMIQGRKLEDSDQEIDSVIDPIAELAKEKENKRLSEKLIDCRHKLYAVKYHLLSIKNEIKERVGEFEKNYSAGAGIAFETENPRLVYEAEAFLFQVKSSLDILVQGLGGVIPPLKSMHSFKSKNIDGVEHSGGSVITALKTNGFESLGELFETHRAEWIQDLVDMRDTITHYSRLRHFHCFIEEPYMGGNEVIIHYPTMPTGVRVDVYCETNYEKLLQLYKSVLAAIKIE